MSTMSRTNSWRFRAALLPALGLIAGMLLTNSARAQSDEIGGPTRVAPQYVPPPTRYIPDFSTPPGLYNRGVNPMNDFGYPMPIWRYRGYRVGNYDEWGNLHTNTDLGYRGPIYQTWGIYHPSALYGDWY
jgi:hypothetical protein